MSEKPTLDPKDVAICRLQRKLARARKRARDLEIIYGSVSFKTRESSLWRSWHAVADANLRLIKENEQLKRDNLELRNAMPLLQRLGLK
jgi:hypothetical protein